MQSTQHRSSVLARLGVARYALHLPVSFYDHTVARDPYVHETGIPAATHSQPHRATHLFDRRWWRLPRPTVVIVLLYVFLYRLVPRVVGTFALHQAQRKSRCRPRRPMAWLRPRPPPLWGDAITRAALGPACWSYLRDIQRHRPPSRPTFITFSMSATKSLSRPAVKVFKRY